MAYEPKPGTGSVFRNNKTNDNQPDLKGDVMTPDGQRLSIAMWEKDGGRYSIKLDAYKAPQPKQDNAELPRKAPAISNDVPFDDSISF